MAEGALATGGTFTVAFAGAGAEGLLNRWFLVGDSAINRVIQK